MRVDHAQVEGSEVRVGIGERNEHGVVDDAGTTLVDFTSGLESVTLIGASGGQRGVGKVELVNPGDELGLAGLGIGHVAVVGANSLTGGVPSETDLLASEGEGLRAVVGDGRTAASAGNVQVDARLVGRNVSGGRVGSAVASTLPVGGVVWRDAVDISLVGNVQSREVLPCETSGVLGARADVRSEESPGPRLGNTGLEPDGHRVETAHLAENHLLASLGSDGLSKELTNLAGVEVVDEAPDTRLTPAGKDLVEVDELTDVGEGVVVGALGRCGVSEHIGQESGVALLLLSHEGDQGAVLSSKTSSEEVLLGEDGKTVVEQIKLNPLLVETKGDGLVVEITLDHVARLRAVGTKATSRGVIDRLRLSELAVLVVVGGGGVGRQHRDGRVHDGSVDSASGGGLTIVGTVARLASHNGTALRASSGGASGHRGGESSGDGGGIVERLRGKRCDGRRSLRNPGGVGVRVTRKSASLVVSDDLASGRGGLRRVALRRGGDKAGEDR